MMDYRFHNVAGQRLLKSVRTDQEYAVVVLTPIYKVDLSHNEVLALKHSFNILSHREIFFVAPEGLDVGFYNKYFPSVGFCRFPDEYFVSINAYSKLLTSNFFYDVYLDFSHILILQPDCIVFRDDLDCWVASGYDYVGAPWPSIWKYQFPMVGSRFDGEVFYIGVGNGGLSLRKTSSFVEALNQFQWVLRLHSEVVEDAFFSLVGHLSFKFKIPNAFSAAQFSIECEPRKYTRIIQGLPMGVHAWEKWDKEFWLQHFTELDVNFEQRWKVECVVARFG